MTSWLKAQPHLADALRITNSVITRTIYIAYPALLIWIALQAAGFVRPELLVSNGTQELGTIVAGAIALPEMGSEWGSVSQEAQALIRAIIVPFISFVLVTVVRQVINAPRPYEVFDAQPSITKDTRGHSFPSRHTFSIFVIGITYLASCSSPVPGAIVLALGCVLATLRVVGGVHFPRDVISGALLGIASGFVGFCLL